MRHLMIAVLSALVLATPVSGQDRGAIADTIDAQIDAFRDDDFARAFTFASPGIRRIFQTPEVFGDMVRNGYPMVWRPARVEYLEQMETNGRVFQKVLIHDRAGERHMLLYEMIASGNSWLINGVSVLRAAELGV